MRFNSLVDSKSKSRIRIDKNVKKEPSHCQVLQYIKENFMTETLEVWLNTVINTLTDEKIREIIDNYAGNEISLERAELIYRFICKKIRLLEEIFFGKEE